jgi:2-desacetyl-2-hydroxyethyl bacteriochlorophyllide A dehydrogenase
MATTMKSAVLVAPRRIEIREEPVPDPKPGWVRIKTKAAGICGSDLHSYTGNHPWLAPGSAMRGMVLDKVYGHEVGGVVDAVGDGVTRVREGDRVALEGIVPCMACEYCRVGLYQICGHLKHLGIHYPGGFAEYVLMPEGAVRPVPDTVSFEEASLLDVAVVGVHAVHVAQISMVDRVVVLGGGPIGMAIVSAARRAGAREVLLVAPFPAQRELALTAGATRAFDAGDAATDAVLGATDSLGADCVLEAVGYKARTIQQAVAMIRKGGRIVFTGVFEEPVCLNFGDLLAKEATLKASHAYGMWDLVSEQVIALGMLERGEFPASRLITHRFGLDQIGDAFETKLAHPETANKVEIVFE